MKEKRHLMDFIESKTFTLAVVDCGEWFYVSRYVERTSPEAYANESDNYSELCKLALKADSEKKNNSVYFIFKNNDEEINNFLKERNIKKISYV